MPAFARGPGLDVHDGRLITTHGDHLAPRVAPPPSTIGEAGRALAVARSDGTVVHASDGFCRLFELRRCQVEGAKLWEVGIAERARLRWLLERLPTSGSGLRYRRSYAVSSGTRVLELEAYGFPAGGAFYLIVAAREPEPDDPGAADAELLDAVMEASSIGLVLYDRELRIVRVNRAAELMGRVTPRDLGLPLPDAFSTADPRIVEAIRRVFDTAEPISNVAVTAGDGRSFLASFFPVRQGSGPVRYVGSIFSDVTELASAQRQMHELAAVVSFSDDAILSEDTAGVIRSWNAGAERLYGYSADEAVGRPVTLIVPRGRRRELHEVRRRITAGEHIQRLETVRRRKDGSPVHVSLTMSPIRASDDGVIGAAVIARDVTDRVAAQRALAESEQNRREILASMLRSQEVERNRIATELHDDTVQVMTAVLIGLDRVAARAKKAGSEEVAAAIVSARATLDEATERARRLMFELRPAVLHEQGLVAAIRMLVQQVGREVGAHTSVRGTLGRYEPATEQLVFRSLQEALANVRKHAHPRSIVVTLAERGGVLTSEVYDDGRGFEPDIVRLRPRASMHIGISSMIERIRAVDGDVTINSAPDQGTTVRIAVPAR